MHSRTRLHVCVHASTRTRAVHLRRFFSSVAINCHESRPSRANARRSASTPTAGDTVTTHHARSRSTRCVSLSLSFSLHGSFGSRGEKKRTTRKIITGLRVITRAAPCGNRGSTGRKNDARHNLGFFFPSFFRSIFFADTFTGLAIGYRETGVKRGEEEDAIRESSPAQKSRERRSAVLVMQGGKGFD